MHNIYPIRGVDLLYFCILRNVLKYSIFYSINLKFNYMNNLRFLQILCSALLPVSVYGISKSDKPNILILTADDLGWNDISSPLTTSYANSKNHQTPNIDRLISNGMAFTNAYTQQNSAPTRAALLTGQYAVHNGVYNVTSLARYGNKKKGGITKQQARIIPPKQNGAIDSGTITFAEVLEDGGYQTYIFGKVHGWGGDLSGHGFTHDFSCSKTVNMKGEKLSNYFAYQTQEGGWIFDNEVYNKYASPYTEEYIKKNLIPVANGNDPMTLVGKRKHFTDAIGDCVIDQLATVDKNTPFCMWVCFHAIHSAIVGREDLISKYKQRKDKDNRHRNPDYAALTEQLDQTVGRIMTALNDPNGDGDTSDSMIDNTIVMFMSDNGGVGGSHSNAPLRGAKGMFYEGGIRVPMCVTYPKMIKPRTITDEPVHVIDYYPTLVELAGLEIPSSEKHLLDGESFVKLLNNPDAELDREAIYWYFPGYMDNRLVPSLMINKRVGDKRYKLKYSYETETYELYCLTDDISEKNDLMKSSNKEYINIARNLRDDFCGWLENNPPLLMKYRNTGNVVGFPILIK